METDNRQSRITSFASPVGTHCCDDTGAPGNNTGDWRCAPTKFADPFIGMHIVT